MSKFVIVWNDSKTEGVIFKENEPENSWDSGSVADALHAANYDESSPVSSLADYFKETYGEGGSCTIQDVEIDETKAVEPHAY